MVHRQALRIIAWHAPPPPPQQKTNNKEGISYPPHVEYGGQLCGLCPGNHHQYPAFNSNKIELKIIRMIYKGNERVYKRMVK